MENSNSNNIIEKKKRGRKPKSQDVSLNIIENTQTDEVVEKPIKKRGRKPKGGKVITLTNPDNSKDNQEKNIILHLKCKLSDKDKEDNNIFENYKFNENKYGELNYTLYDKEMASQCKSESIKNENKNIENNNNENIKDIWSKLKNLSKKLHINDVCDKKSSCFHCTFDFDNVPIYIPKYELNDSYYVYGCFCSPECACAYLMNEKDIDTSSRFERYHLLNFLYCKIYNYSKNIKPAPCPYYTLEKYYGSLTIQEYRQLLKNERLLLIVDKPLVRQMPDLHEESDYTFNNNLNGTLSKINNFNNNDKKNKKSEILNENFNFK
tara:strand:- start:4830 stop:5795 length:966 start_codon:yes stop_codon:yes gene_type:complete